MKTLLPLFAILSGCTSGQRSALEDARTLWETSAPTSYAFDIRYSCFCPQMRASVEVSEGNAVILQTGEEDFPFPLNSGMAAVFDRVEVAIDEADEVTVSYASTYGFPEIVSVDAIREAVDDEWSLTVSNFTDLTNGSP